MAKFVGFSLVFCALIVHIRALPVPSSYDYHDVNYVNLDNTYMSKPAYDYSLPYQPHTGFHGSGQGYLRQEYPTFHILKPQYPSHLYPLHSVFFLSASGHQQQQQQSPVYQQRFEPEALEQDAVPEDQQQYHEQQQQQQGPVHAPKFHIQPPQAVQVVPTGHPTAYFFPMISEIQPQNMGVYNMEHKTFDALPESSQQDESLQLSDDVPQQPSLELQPPVHEFGGASGSRNDADVIMSDPQEKIPSLQLDSSYSDTSSEKLMLVNRGQQPLIIPQIPAHLLPLQNSAIQTHETFPDSEEKDQDSKMEGETLKGEENVPTSEAPSESENNNSGPSGNNMESGPASGMNVPVPMDNNSNINKEEESNNNFAEDEIMITTTDSSNINVNAEVVTESKNNSDVQGQEDHSVEMEATTEAASL